MSDEDDDAEAPEPVDKRDRSPEAEARGWARRRWRTDAKNPRITASTRAGALDRLRCIPVDKRTPYQQSRLRELRAYERAHRYGDMLTVRWDSSRGKSNAHHPFSGWDEFIAEGPAPLPLTATLADLAVAVRNDHLELWALAAAPDPEAPADAADRVLQRLWAAETRPFHLVRCLVSRGDAICVAFVRAMRSRVLRERFPCYECGDLHENLMAYRYDRARCLWPENDIVCVGCADALRAAVVDMRLRWLDPITPKRREGFARQTWEGAKRANRVY